MNKSYIVAGALTLTGLGIGFAAGYLVSKKKYESILDAEIASVKAAYDPSRKEGIFSTPEGAVQALIGEKAEAARGRKLVEDLLQDNGYSVDQDQDREWARQAEALDAEERIEDGANFPDGDAIVQSILDNGAARENPNAVDQSSEPEMPDRNADRPYVITLEQFMADGIHEDNKVSLLFFEEDGQLVDERETLVPNVEEVLGEKNLTHFGLGSNDRNAVYIRNEKLTCDFEVIRDSRSFSEVVLGVKPAREASSLRKMRDDDE